MTLKQKQPRKSPSQTIQAYCHYCVQSRKNSDVENCGGYMVLATGKPCTYNEYRMGNKRASVRIMRRYCLDDCMKGSKEAVRECTTVDCLNYPFRFGKNPSLAGKGKSKDEMIRVRALRKPIIKENPGKFEQTENRA